MLLLALAFLNIPAHAEDAVAPPKPDCEGYYTCALTARDNYFDCWAYLDASECKAVFDRQDFACHKKHYCPGGTVIRPNRR